MQKNTIGGILLSSHGSLEGGLPLQCEALSGHRQLVELPNLTPPEQACSQGYPGNKICWRLTSVIV